MSDTDIPLERRTERSTSSFWIAALFALPFLYALSVGPAVALMSRFEFLEEPFTVIYTPLDIVLNTLLGTAWGAPLEPYLEKYLEWWAA